MQIYKKNSIGSVLNIFAMSDAIVYEHKGKLFGEKNHWEYPVSAFLTNEKGASNNIYAKSNSKLYCFTNGAFIPVNIPNGETFKVIENDKYIVINPDGKKRSYSLFREGVEVWNVPKEKGMPIYRGNTLVTFPDFKHKALHFREMDTFEIKKEISATEPFEFIRNSHHVFDDRVIFFQYQKKRDTSKMQQVIATCCDLDSGKILWETAFQGSHRYILNDADGNLYALFGRHEPGGETLYLNYLNPTTGQAKLEVVEKNTIVASTPWLAQIYKNVMYISDIYTEGCVIWAFDLTTKKILTHFNLGLDKGTSLKAPVIRNDELYVLDSTETLHVFDIVY